jgi:hypothetical protein
MTTKFEADVAAAYKAVDERVEVICAVAARLLTNLELNMTPAGYILPDKNTVRLMAELCRVMR